MERSVGAAALTGQRVERLEGLDALRGIAASCVVLHHVHHIGKVPLLPWLAPVGSQFGMSVPLFFIISAFTMYHVYFRDSREPNFVYGFIVRRYFRLLPVFLICFLVQAALGILANGETNLTPGAVLWYVSLLFGFNAEYVLGYVGVSWSIGVEFVFYLLFPVIVTFVRGVRSAGLLFLATLVVSYDYQGLLQAHPPAAPNYWALNPILFSSCFSAGVLLYFVYRALEPRWAALRPSLFSIVHIVAFLFVLTIAAATYWLQPPIEPQALPVWYWWKVHSWIPFFVLLLAYVLAFQNNLLTNVVTLYLGKLSYSIYMVHSLFIYHLLRPLFQSINESFGPYSFFACAAIALGLTIGASALLYRYVERPGIALGGRLTRARTPS